MIDRQRVRRLAIERPRASEGFGVAQHGRLIVDTIRSDPDRAKQAAIGMFRSNGIRWSLLKELGYEIVPIAASISGAVSHMDGTRRQTAARHG